MGAAVTTRTWAKSIIEGVSGGYDIIDKARLDGITSGPGK